MSIILAPWRIDRFGYFRVPVDVSGNDDFLTVLEPCVPGLLAWDVRLPRSLRSFLFHASGRAGISKTPDQEKHERTRKRTSRGYKPILPTTTAPASARRLWLPDSKDSTGCGHRGIRYPHAHPGAMHSAPAGRAGPDGHRPNRHRQNRRLYLAAPAAAFPQRRPARKRNPAGPDTSPHP